MGENICRRMHFDIRRTDLFWKIGRLCEQCEKLEELFDRGVLRESGKDYYIIISRMIREYIGASVAEGE